MRTLGDADLAVVDERAGVEDRLVAADLVRRALARLKPDDATLLLLRWQEGFSNDEVAAILRISPDALKKRLYLARKAFGAAYAREAADPKGDSHV